MNLLIVILLLAQTAAIVALVFIVLGKVPTTRERLPRAEERQPKSVEEAEEELMDTVSTYLRRGNPDDAIAAHLEAKALEHARKKEPYLAKEAR